MLLETIKYRCGLFHFDKHFVRPVCRNISSFCGSFADNTCQNLCVRENPVHVSWIWLLFTKHFNRFIHQQFARRILVPVEGVLPSEGCATHARVRFDSRVSLHVPLEMVRCDVAPTEFALLVYARKRIWGWQFSIWNKGKKHTILMLKKPTINHLNTSHNNYVYKTCSCFELEVLFQTIQASISKQRPPFLKHPSITPDVLNN